MSGDGFGADQGNQSQGSSYLNQWSTFADESGEEAGYEAGSYADVRPPIERLLDEGAELEDLLDDDELLEELRRGNPRLVARLCAPEALRALAALVVYGELPHDDGLNERRELPFQKRRRPWIATEVLTSSIEDVPLGLLRPDGHSEDGEEAPVDVLWGFLDLEPCGDFSTAAAGYSCSVVWGLLSRWTSELALHLQRRKPAKLLERMLARLDSRPCVELLAALLCADDASRLVFPVEGLVLRLIRCLEEASALPGDALEHVSFVLDVLFARACAGALCCGDALLQQLAACDAAPALVSRALGAGRRPAQDAAAAVLGSAVSHLHYISPSALLPLRGDELRLPLPRLLPQNSVAPLLPPSALMPPPPPPPPVAPPPLPPVEPPSLHDGAFEDEAEPEPEEGGHLSNPFDDDPPDGDGDGDGDLAGMMDVGDLSPPAAGVLSQADDADAVPFNPFDDEVAPSTPPPSPPRPHQPSGAEAVSAAAFAVVGEVCARLPVLCGALDLALDCEQRRRRRAPRRGRSLQAPRGRGRTDSGGGSSSGGEPLFLDESDDDDRRDGGGGSSSGGEPLYGGGSSSDDERKGESAAAGVKRVHDFHPLERQPLAQEAAPASPEAAAAGEEAPAAPPEPEMPACSTIAEVVRLLALLARSGRGDFLDAALELRLLPRCLGLMPCYPRSSLLHNTVQSLISEAVASESHGTRLAAQLLGDVPALAVFREAFSLAHAARLALLEDAVGPPGGFRLGASRRNRRRRAPVALAMERRPLYMGQLCALVGDLRELAAREPEVANALEQADEAMGYRDDVLPELESVMDAQSRPLGGGVLAPEDRAVLDAAAAARDHGFTAVTEEPSTESDLKPFLARAMAHLDDDDEEADLNLEDLRDFGDGDEEVIYCDNERHLEPLGAGACRSGPSGVAAELEAEEAEEEELPSYAARSGADETRGSDLRGAAFPQLVDDGLDDLLPPPPPPALPAPPELPEQPEPIETLASNGEREAESIADSGASSGDVIANTTGSASEAA